VSDRLRVQKTLKLFIGGEFPRSESGRTLPVRTARGETMHVSRASRKDLREAVEKARAAQAGWWKKTAYNRGQILYRLGEMIEDRLGADAAPAVDRAVHHAGWTDKITAVLSSLNPVAATYVNYSMVGPTGVVVAIPDPADGLLGLVEAVCGPLVMGNSVIVLVAASNAEEAFALAECIATSDMPGGVVNLLTGDIEELISAANVHDDIDALYMTEGGTTTEQRKKAEIEAATMMRRLLVVKGATSPATPLQLQKLAEVKTVWMSS
jgi:acyl-CoA reductase-like NAD-dependent aldehyde dehydrogenase